MASSLLPGPNGKALPGSGARYEAVVFDLDGTLWDATEIVARAWDAVVRRQRPGYRAIDRADIVGVMGLPHEPLARQMFPDVPPTEREALVRMCYAEEETLLRQEGGAVYPGVKEGLAELAQRVPLAIVSNCQAGYVETFFAVTGLRALFRDFECHGNTGHSKGQNLADVVRRSGLGRAVYVGDTAGDEEAAAQAGVPFLHASYGFGRPVGPARAFATFPDLAAHLIERTGRP